MYHTYRPVLARRTSALLALVALSLLTLVQFWSAPPVLAADCAWITGDGNWSDSNKWNCGHVPGSGDNATISSSNVTFDGSYVLYDFHLTGGKLIASSPYNLEVTHAMTWSGGILQGSGALNIDSGANLTVSGSNMYLDGWALNNSGSAAWQGNTDLGVTSGGTFNNQAGATLTISTAGRLIGGLTGPEGALNNAGTIVLNAGTAAFSLGPGVSGLKVALNNSGIIQIPSGNFDISGGGTSTGDWAIGSSGQLRFKNAFDPGAGKVNYTLDTGSDVTGYGNVEFLNGSVQVNGTFALGGTTQIGAGGTVKIGDSATLTSMGNFVQLNGGHLETNKSFTVPVAMTWAGGTFKGPGSLTIPAGATLTMSGSIYLDGATVNNNGIATSTGSIAFYASNAGSWNNGANAVLDFQGDGQFVGNTGLDGALNNAGTIRKSGGANVLKLVSGGYGAQMVLNNTGKLQVQSGTLYLHGSGSYFTQFSGTTLSGGSYEVTGATLRFDGANIVTNGASIVLDGASASISNGSSSALANFATNSASGQLTIKNGANLTVPAAFSNAGSVTIGSGSTFSVAVGNYNQSGGTTKLQSGTLAAAGAVNINGGTLTGSGSVNSSLVNGGTVSPGSSVGTISVTGSYVQSASGALNVELAAATAGQYDVLSVTGTSTLDGTLNVTRLGGFTPVTGNAFDIVVDSSETGTFATANGLNLGSGMALAVQYKPAKVTLAAGPSGLTITSIDPTAALAGGPDFTLTVNGTGFENGAQVLFNGAARSTTYVDSTKVTATVLADDIKTAGTANISIRNPGGLASDTTPFSIQANLIATNAVLHTSVTPSVFGQPVTFTVDVTPAMVGSAPLTGSVTLFEVIDMGTTPSSRGVPAKRPLAAFKLVATTKSYSITTAKLSGGTHTIGAAYSGDSNYAPSIATPITQVVNKAKTSVALVSSAPTSYEKQPVTFSATVSIQSPGAGLIAGNVKFTYSGNPIAGCEAQGLANGVATCITSSIPVGSLQIKAEYLGSEKFEGSYKTLTQSVLAFKKVSVSGLVFNDSNKDGVHQWIEPGLPLQTVQLVDLANMAILQSKGTDAQGHFKFDPIGWGIYRVRLAPKSGWYQTTTPVFNGALDKFTPQSGVNIANINIGRVLGTDLKVRITSSATSVARGTNLIYKIYATNAGVTLAPTSVLGFKIPAYTSYVSLTKAGFPWVCTNALGGLLNGGSVNCATPGFLAGASSSLTLTVKVAASAPVGTVLQNTAKINSAIYDPDKSNNTASVNVTVK